MKRGRWARWRMAKAQSTLEYLLVVIAVLIAIIAAVNTVINPRVTNQLTSAGSAMDTAANRFKTATGQ